MFNKRLLVEFKETRGYMAGIVVLQWAMLFINIIFYYATAKLVDRLFETKLTNSRIGIYILIIGVAIAVRIVLTKVSGILSYYASVGVKSKMRSLIYQKLVKIGMDYMDWCPSSEVVQLSTEGVEHLDIYFGKYIPQFFYALLAPLTLFIIVSFIYFPAAIILLLCVPLIPISIIIVQKFAKKLLDKYWGIYTDLGDTFLESLQGLTTMKIYNSDDFYAQKLHNDSENFRKITMRVLIMQLNSISVMDIVAYGGSAIGILVSVLGLRKEAISLAECFFIIMISSEFFLPMRLLGSYFHVAMNGNSTADRIFKMLDIPDRKESIEAEVSEPHLEPMLESLSGEHGTAIEFQDVTFAYKEGEKEVLKHIHLTVPAHTIVALVGKSGCGKSTMASLIMGEHMDYTGKILIDGHDRRQVSEGACMKHITRIDHGNFLFAGTLFDNLYMGFPKEEREKIDRTSPEGYALLSEKMIEALREVQIYSFVKASGGLSMKIEANAANLSGGQKQRIALARAILQNSQVYIFDEATSNIDVESEKKIMEVIYKLAETKTVVIISHRLANIIQADKIVMMKEGEIVQEGTHQELVAQVPSPYQQLYEGQQELEKYTTVHKEEWDSIEEEEEEEEREEEAKHLIPENEKNSSPDSNSTHHTSSPIHSSQIKEHIRKRSGFNIMMGMIVLVKPLTGYMCLAVFLGCLGHFSAIFITVLGGYGIKEVIGNSSSLAFILTILCVLAIVRGFLRYGEQALNHFIAFKLLAVIRDEIFNALRRLAPAKLEGKGKGHFISLITADTELLEVFYAHTISPILIAIITSIVMIVFIGWPHWLLAVITLVCHVLVGIVIPFINSCHGGNDGLSYREGVADLNTVVLDNLRGMREIIQYRYQKEREVITKDQNDNLKGLQRHLKSLESTQMSITNAAIVLGSAVMAIVVSLLVRKGEITFNSGLISLIALMSSFGPTVAISALSNNLNQTLASGERVLDLLEEKPLLEDVVNGKEMPSGSIHVQNVTFAYPKENSISSRDQKLNTTSENITCSSCALIRADSTEVEEKELVLKDYTNDFEKGKIIGIIGKSGCGKSTLLKLLMRFYDPLAGQILYDQTPIQEITTTKLRQSIAYVTQETYLFHDTIANNLKLARLEATPQELEEACKKAAIHDFIQGLPNGYDTKLAELGDSLSGGERQRLGMARAFLSGSDIFLLDEPTSNLDSLNEAILLKSLKDEDSSSLSKPRTILLVSHRKSTMAVTDTLYKM